MSKGRKNGCPVNIKNWLVSIEDKATNEFVRIFGLNSLENSTESETKDGSSETDDWAEPFVNKRSGKLTLSGKPVVVESTGVKDQGQEMLDEYAKQTGCDADATLKFVDPYGHGWKADYIVTSSKESADSDGIERNWELEQVGEAEVLPYKHVSTVSLKDGDNVVTTLSIAEGAAAKIITIVFDPEDASNQRFKVSNSKRAIAAVGNVTENSFTVTPIAAGTTTITVTSVNGGKTASLAVTVTTGA